MKDSLTALSVMFALVVSLEAAGADYFVDNRYGSDANDGLAADRAFATFAKAMPHLKPGDTLSIAPGRVYRESIVVRSSGTAEAPIVIRGNGAVLSGLSPLPASEWEDRGGGLFRFPYASRFGDPQLTLGPDRERIITVGGDPAALAPGKASWRIGDGFYFRAETGKTPGDYDLHGFLVRGPIYHSGVYLENRSYVTVENLVCECFANDGFNVQLSSHGLVFRNITGRYNGDDGFSVHEDVQACVYHGCFHHNDFGIQDVNLSQTSFFDCTAVSNRYCGVDVMGGMRVFRGLTVFDNRHDQIRVHGSTAAHVGLPATDPMLRGLAYFTDATVSGGPGRGLFVNRGAGVSARNLRISGVDRGLVVLGDMDLVNGEITGCREKAVETDSARSFTSTRFP